MAAIFVLLSLALVAGALGRFGVTAAAGALALLLAAGLFLYEIRSPEDGFAMPWLEVRAGQGIGTAAA